jgi:lipoprotein NlpI
MKKICGALAIVTAAVFCSSTAFAFSAVGLRNSLQNCLNKETPPADRITACNQVMHTNILLPHDRARVITSRGNAYFASANLDSAFDDYSKAEALNPRLPPAFINHGVALIQLGKCEAAIADFNAALSLDPHVWQALYGRSVCEAKAGDQAKSQSDLAAATTIDPDAARQFAPVEISRWYQ